MTENMSEFILCAGIFLFVVGLASFAAWAWIKHPDIIKFFEDD